MSLLADLLSKKNSGGLSSAKDIPPTLTRSHDIPAKVRNHNSRYVIISVVSVAVIAIGILATSQFDRLTSLLTKKPVQSPQPVKPPVAVVPAAPVPQAMIAPPAPPQVIEPEKPAVPKLGKKTATKPETARLKHVRLKSVARPGTTHRLTANQPAQRITTKYRTVPAAPARDTASSGKIDTAKRDSLLYAARSAEQASDWRLALVYYHKAQKIDPDNFVIMNNTAAALNNLGMFDEGGKEARRALGKKPDYVPAMINAAIAYSSKGNNQEALRLFSEASITDPGNRSLIINLGILQERTGKPDDALITYRYLAENGDPLALLGMGRIYENKGNRSEAVRAYRQIMILPNANAALKKEAKKNLVRLEE